MDQSMVLHREGVSYDNSVYSTAGGIVRRSASCRKSKTHDSRHKKKNAKRDPPPPPPSFAPSFLFPACERTSRPPLFFSLSSPVSYSLFIFLIHRAARGFSSGISPGWVEEQDGLIRVIGARRGAGPGWAGPCLLFTRMSGLLFSVCHHGVSKAQQPRQQRMASITDEKLQPESWPQAQKGCLLLAFYFVFLFYFFGTRDVRIKTCED